MKQPQPFTHIEVAPTLTVDGDTTAYGSVRAAEAAWVEAYRAGRTVSEISWSLYGFAEDCMSVFLCDVMTEGEALALASRLTGAPIKPLSGHRVFVLPTRRSSLDPLLASD